MPLINCRCHLILNDINEVVIGRTEINQAQQFKGHIVDITHTNEGNDKMSIEIHVDRIKKYKLTGIDALHEDNLPNEYTYTSRHIYKYGADGCYCKLTYFNHRTKMYHALDINLGDEFTESEMRILNHRIRIAGERLGRINQKIKRENDRKEKETPPKPIRVYNQKHNFWFNDWSGSYTFKV